MARPKKDKKKEEARIAAKKQRITDEKALELKTKPEPVKKMTVDDRLDRLEFIVRKMAHHNGLTKIVKEAGIKEWIPGKRDMTKWKNEVKDKQ